MWLISNDHVTVWLSALAVAEEHGHCGEPEPPHFNSSQSLFSGHDNRSYKILFLTPNLHLGRLTKASQVMDNRI